MTYQIGTTDSTHNLESPTLKKLFLITKKRKGPNKLSYQNSRILLFPNLIVTKEKVFLRLFKFLSFICKKVPDCQIKDDDKIL